MSNKPDKKQIKSNIRQAQQIDSRLKAALDGEREELAKLRKAADQFLSARIQASLEAMDVDMLTQGKQKIRVSYLRSAGIQNMWQLSKMSRQQIEDLDGIGAQGATAIYDLTKQIVKNAKEKLSVRIQSDSPTKADDALVAALYCVIVHGQQRQQIKSLYEGHHKPLAKEIAAAQKAASGFSWFFASAKERETALAAAAALQERLEGEFGDLSLLEAYDGVAKADVTECYAHFRDHAADYYAALEKYCTQLPVAQDTKAGLPEELVAQIEATQIDLTGLKATLRSYQDFGVRYAVHQKRTLLGDEMGLGKTIQAIAEQGVFHIEKCNFRTVDRAIINNHVYSDKLPFLPLCLGAVYAPLHKLWDLNFVDNYHLSIYPQPILTIYRYTRYHLIGDRRYGGIGTIYEPSIGLMLAGVSSNPLSFHRSIKTIKAIATRI